MKVNVMELRDTGDLQTDTTLLQVDDGILITVIGFGTAEYKWKVTDCERGGSTECTKTQLQQLNDIAWLEGAWLTDGFFVGSKTLGVAMVWAEHYTFAHVVMDLINNQ